jgi:hypothetical protein
MYYRPQATPFTVRPCAAAGMTHPLMLCLAAYIGNQLQSPWQPHMRCVFTQNLQPFSKIKSWKLFWTHGSDGDEIG